MSTDFLADLERRGLLHQISSPALGDLLRGEQVTAYIGFDPSADSLHIGHLLALITLKRFQRAGHLPIGLVGGGTGLIGDPSGKQAERTLRSRDEIERDIAAIRAQVEPFLDFDAGARLVNNAEWLCDLNLIDFLRDIGKHFSVNQMIVRDSVRMRLETREQGISYTEFTYMLLQSYDYLALFDRYGCKLQLGGSDQWGNIVSGTDLVRRLRGVETYGLTMPLVTRADGRKFGKSEEGNVWLSPARTSPYEFYQFWLNVEDADVVRYLNYFTFLSADETAALAAAVDEAPQQRAAQRRLAEEVTGLVHGADGLERARRVTAALFDKHADYRALSESELQDAFGAAPTTALGRTALDSEDAGLLNILATTGLYPSKGRARKDLPQGAVTVNNVVVQDPDYVLSERDLLPGGFIVLRKGKKTYHVVRVGDA